MSDRDPLLELAAEMGSAVGQIDERIFAIETRATENETATVALIVELERGIADLRRRLEALEALAAAPQPGPRLIGGRDAA